MNQEKWRYFTPPARDIDPKYWTEDQKNAWDSIVWWALDPIMENGYDIETPEGEELAEMLARDWFWLGMIPPDSYRP